MRVIEPILNPGKLASTRNLDEDVGHLCEQVYKLLGYMQEPMFSGNLVSLTQTVKSTLNLVTCAAMFLEDYFKPKLNGGPYTHRLTNADLPPFQRSRQPCLQKTNLRRVWQTDYDYEELP
jgi:hypothetical protein